VQLSGGLSGFPSGKQTLLVWEALRAEKLKRFLAEYPRDKVDLKPCDAAKDPHRSLSGSLKTPVDRFTEICNR